MMDKELALRKLKRDLEALTSPEGYLYAGVPTKFMGLFGRDSLISGWQLLDYDPNFAKQALIHLAEIQGKKLDPTTGEEPGKIPHEFYSKNVPDNWFLNHKHGIKWLEKEKPVYFSVDSTPLFIIVTGKYYKKTKDEALIKKLAPNIEKAVHWILDYGIKDGFLRYGENSKENGLISQSWKDGIGSTLEGEKAPIAVVEVQGYIFQVYQEIKKLVPVLGKTKELDELRKVSDIIQKEFDKKFWMDDKNFYCLALDGDDKQIKRITSNPGQLLFTDLLNKERIAQVVKRLFQEDLWTQYGIRTHSTSESDFDPLSYQRGSVWPHDNWIIAQGLMKQGYRKEARQIKEAIFRAYENLGFLPEFYGVTPDGEITIEDLEDKPVYIQSWSVGTMINFLTPVYWRL